MKLIPLTRGQFSQVDDEDYDFLMQWKWYAQWVGNSYYAFRGFRNSSEFYGVKKISMHRLIMNTEEGEVVDHIDHNGLNNQKLNMRNCTYSENLINRKKFKKCEYKGVHINGKYITSSISKEGNSIYLGSFKNIIDAAIAYDKAAKKLHGNFALLNFY